MMESWTGTEFAKNGRGRVGLIGSIATWSGVAFAIIGAIGDATSTIYGLYPTTWLLLAIATLIFGLTCWFSWAVGMYLYLKEKKNEE